MCSLLTLAAILVLILVLVIPFAAESCAASAEDIGTLEQPLPSATVYDINGNLIRNTTIGHPVVISREYTNSQYARIDFTLLIEVRDVSGITQYLAWQKGTALPMDTKTVGASWIPEVAGNYQIRTFVVSNLTNPSVIDNVEIGEFAVLDSRKVFTLDVYGTSYDIEYLLDAGFVSQFDYDSVLATITVELDGVTRATELSLHIPKEMLDEEFMCKIGAIPTSSIDALVILVDTVETEMNAMETEESLIVPVKLGAGAELVEVIGCAVP